MCGAPLGRQVFAADALGTCLVASAECLHSSLAMDFRAI